MKQNFQKNKVVTGQTPFFVTGSFCTTHCVILTSNFDMVYGNVSFSILALSIKKRCISFLTKAGPATFLKRDSNTGVYLSEIFFQS